MPIIHFVNEDKKVEVNSGSNIRKVAKSCGVQIYKGLEKIFNCHGNSLCGTCDVEVEATNSRHLSPKRPGEQKVLQKKKRDGEGRRLACQCNIYGQSDELIKVYTLTK